MRTTYASARESEWVGNPRVGKFKSSRATTEPRGAHAKTTDPDSSDVTGATGMNESSNSGERATVVEFISKVI
jgi:hypothetical protein